MVARARTEQEKMRRVPGIVFATEGDDRVARIEGTGLEVAEIIQVFLADGRNREKLRRVFPWLSQQQFDAALRYYAAYPDEIDAAIAENELPDG